jgi:ankyrin repeat protein
MKIAPSLKEHLSGDLWGALETFLKTSKDDENDLSSSTYADVNASSEFIKWLEMLSEDDQKKLMAAFHAGSLKVHAHENKNDTLVLLWMQLVVGVSILVDYFCFQTWPSGSNRQCRWAYFASVVMYKPFTIPMWSLLITSCHYCFAENLFGNIASLRDVRTGTIHGSPLPRSKATLCLVSIVFGLQLFWFVGVAPVILPLVVVFLPAVLLPSFFIPLVVIGVVEFSLSIIVNFLGSFFKAFVLEEVKKDGSVVRKVWPWFRQDKDILQAAARQDKREFEYYSREEQILAACAAFGPRLAEDSSDETKNDKRFVMASVKCDYACLKYASDALKADKEVVMTAVKRDGRALYNAASELKGDKEVIMAALNHNAKDLNYAGRDFKLKLLEIVSDELKLDKFVIAASERDDGESHVAEHPKHAMKKNEDGSFVLVKPPPFDETVFSLKASATQLVSIIVLSFLLLPFYHNRYAWGAIIQNFVFVNFNLPNLILQFSISFSWPDFDQPRLQVQLLIGITLTFLQYITKFGKFLLCTYENSNMMSNNKPGFWEILMMKLFSGITWQVFGKPMDLIRSSWERLSSEVRRRKMQTPNDYGVVIAKIVSAFPMLLYYSYQYPLVKTMNELSGDIEVFTFCNSEASMAVRSIELIGNRTTLSSLEIVQRSCPWITVTKLKISPTESSSFEDLCEALKPFESSLKELDLCGCSNIRGQLSTLNGGFKSLLFLNVLCSGISIDQNNTADMHLLKAILNAPYADQMNDINIKNVDVLVWTVDQKYLQLLEVLIKSGAEIDTKNKRNGNTALCNAAGLGSNDGTASEIVECVNVLIKAGANVNIANSSGETPLFVASMSKRVEVVKALIQAGADVNIANRQGETPLFIAAMWGGDSGIEVVKLLIEFGADVNIADENGETPLLQARSGSEIEALLLAAGAKQDVTDTDLDADSDNGTAM